MVIVSSSQGCLSEVPASHPITFLTNPPSKEVFKKLVKKHVIDFWELKSRGDAKPLLSLHYFRPQCMSLVKPHPLLVTAGASPYEVAKATVHTLFLSGRYRTEQLYRHWSSNSIFFPLAWDWEGVKEDLEHILLKCGFLAGLRKMLFNYMLIIFTHKTNMFLLFLGPTLLLQLQQKWFTQGKCFYSFCIITMQIY